MMWTNNIPLRLGHLDILHHPVGVDLNTPQYNAVKTGGGDVKEKEREMKGMWEAKGSNKYA